MACHYSVKMVEDKWSADPKDFSDVHPQGTIWKAHLQFTILLQVQNQNKVTMRLINTLTFATLNINSFSKIPTALKMSSLRYLKTETEELNVAGSFSFFQ